MSTFRYSFFFLTFVFVFSAFAGNGGSGYSRYGIGDIRYSFNDISAGMGNTTIAVFSTNNINQFNPATWSPLSRTRYSIAFKYEGYNTTDGNHSVYLSGTKFDGLMIGIPVYTPSGIVMGMGFTPYSTINYNIISTTSFNSLVYKVRYSGEGGLSEGQIGASWIPYTDFSVGAKLSYYFGSMRHTTSQDFSESNYSNAEETRSMISHGLGGTIGVIYTGLSRSLNLDSTRSLSVGLVTSFGTNLTTREERYYAYTDNSQSLITRDTTSSDDTQIQLPLRLGVGVSYKTSEFLVATDFLYQQWSKLTSVGALAGEFRDSYRFSIGGELFPRREASATFFQRLAYRAGMFTDASYYKINGESINEFGVTGGIGFPIIGETRLNVAAEYSFRGTTDFGLQKDNILRLSFVLSGSERWFIPAEEE